MIEAKASTKTCSNCRFCKEATRSRLRRVVTQTECRRYSPIICPDEYPLDSGWPVVKSDDWCGDYEPLPGEPAITVRTIEK